MSRIYHDNVHPMNGTSSAPVKVTPMLHNVANISADVLEAREVVTIVSDVGVEVVMVIMVDDTILTTHLRHLTIQMNVMYLQLTRTPRQLLNIMLQPLHCSLHHLVAADRVAVVLVHVALIDL